jgi:hypothetical protein
MVNATNEKSIFASTEGGRRYKIPKVIRLFCVVVCMVLIHSPCPWLTMTDQGDHSTTLLLYNFFKKYFSYLKEHKIKKYVLLPPPLTFCCYFFSRYFFSYILEERNDILCNNQLNACCVTNILINGTFQLIERSIYEMNIHLMRYQQ